MGGRDEGTGDTVKQETTEIQMIGDKGYVNSTLRARFLETFGSLTNDQGPNVSV